MGPLWSHAADYLMQNARVLLDAPLVFLAVLVLAFGAAWWLAKVRYAGALDQKTARIELLDARMDDLRRTIAEPRVIALSSGSEVPIETLPHELRTTERAYVFIERLNAELTVLDEGGRNPQLEEFLSPLGLWVTSFAVQPRWRNSGNTPTKNLTVRVDWRGPPDGVLPPNFPYKFRDPAKRMFLGPQATEPGDTIEIAGANEVINRGMEHPADTPMIFVWGRADYEDIFGHAHFTQWCYRVQFERRDSRTLRAQLIQWGDYNRTDHDAP